MPQNPLMKFALKHAGTCLAGFLAFLTLMPASAQAQEKENRKFYPNPGIVANRGGNWVGSDHLYNLTDKIDIAVEIFKPETAVLPVNEEMIRNRVASIFKSANIDPASAKVPGRPPMPFFHILVMIYPFDKAYVSYIEGRLFEQVELERIRLDEQTIMQGVTWESQNVFVAPKEELEKQLFKSVDEIANTFADRFNFYQDIRKQIRKQ